MINIPRLFLVPEHCFGSVNYQQSQHFLAKCQCFLVMNDNKLTKLNYLLAFRECLSSII